MTILPEHKNEWLFSDYLIENQYCTTEDIDRAKSVLKEYSGQMGNVLQNMGVIGEEELIEAYCRYYRFERLQKQKVPFPLDHSAQTAIPKSFFVSNKIYPFYLSKDRLYVAVNEPHKIKELAFIEKIFQRNLRVFLGTENERER